MSQSLNKVVLHIVFSTKNRLRWLDDTICHKLHAYLAGALRNKGVVVYKIGGIDDHIHIACSLPRTLTISDLVKATKNIGSDWIKSQSDKFRDFYWQRGYGVFSISYSHLNLLENYIATRKEHHKKISFQDEFRRLLVKYGIEHDEKYVWD